jgi:hypothetical protein
MPEEKSEELADDGHDISVNLAIHDKNFSK